MTSAAALKPGSAIGVLGGGQLGRLFAQAARAMGYRVVVYSPERGGPAAQVADADFCASYDDRNMLRVFAGSVDVVTLEFENIPISAVETISKVVPVRPGPLALYTAQDRAREKEFLSLHGFPKADHQVVRSVEDARLALHALGAPAVLKTAGFGYDGKGQRVVVTPEAAGLAFEELGADVAVLEEFVDVATEFSVVGARGVGFASGEDGPPVHEFVAFPPIENLHRNHILDASRLPAAVGEDVAAAATGICESMMQTMDVVGLLAVEFFLTARGRLLVNEIAPRPHNSGHLTIESTPVSQFEQQVRAVAGLPLKATQPCRPACMVNLLGDLWEDGEPDWDSITNNPMLHLHLYGKAEARPGRKMGHLTALAGTADDAVRLALEARESLVPAKRRR